MKIKSVTRITLDTPVPVYDITVSETENFTLAAGPVVHNSKDVADAACGVVAYLVTRQHTWTSQPTFRGEGGLMLHGSRMGDTSAQLEELDVSEIPNYSASGRPVANRRSASRMTPRRTPKTE